MSAAPVLMLVMSASMKLIHPPELDQGFVHMGIAPSKALGLGILELTCVAIYLFPRTSVLGAILMTGFLGGATFTHVRVDDPYWVQPLLGMLAWGGLYMRDPRLQELLPLVAPRTRTTLDPK